MRARRKDVSNPVGRDTREAREEQARQARTPENQARLEAQARRRTEGLAQIERGAELERRGLVNPPSHADVLRAAGISETEWIQTMEANRLRAELSSARGNADEANVRRAVLVGALNQALDLGERTRTWVEKHQAGNNARRIVDDGYVEEASRRHCSGEKWDAIAPDYGISSRRLRELVKGKGLPTRGKK